jgi:aminodeoxychorismate lyase
MFVYLAGQFVPETEARVSVFDRGFLYGDGLFETMRVADGRIPHWAAHWARLTRGRERLRLAPAGEAGAAAEAAAELLRRNGVTDGLLRLQLTRGRGVRGFSPRGTASPTLLLTTHPLPAGANAEIPPRWRIVTAHHRVWSGDPLNAVKSCQRLTHVLARAGADDQNADEALLLNERGEVVEATSANLFWLRGHRLATPPLSAGALPGITRRHVLALAAQAGLTVEETAAPPEALARADALFLTNSAWGLVEVARWDDREFPPSRRIAALRARWRADLRG